MKSLQLAVCSLQSAVLAFVNRLTNARTANFDSAQLPTANFDSAQLPTANCRQITRSGSPYSASAK